MKVNAKWIFGLIIFIVLLSGCTSGNKENKSKADKASKTTEQNEEVKQLSFEDYTTEAVRLRFEFSAAIKAYGEVRQTPGTDEEEWSKQSSEKINDIRKVLNEIAMIAPPDDYKEIGEALSAAIEEYHKALDLFEESVEKRDGQLDIKGLDHLQTGQDYWNYAFRLLSINNPLPVEGSDGTIDSQDLKDLDLNAGIDRDSVLMNVSKDGKELIGHWGFLNEDGSPNISIVLYADGSYEGYGNGQFPSKDNAFEGSWEWNYIKGILTFHHDARYNNGEKLKIGEYREKMTMELQRYDEKGIQLFDLESMATFAYQNLDDKVEN